jgi:hypothetical protein
MRRRKACGRLRRGEASTKSLVVLGVIVLLIVIVLGWQCMGKPRVQLGPSATSDLPNWLFISHDGKVRKFLTPEEYDQFTYTEEGDAIQPGTGTRGMVYTRRGDFPPPGGWRE